MQSKHEIGRVEFAGRHPAGHGLDHQAAGRPVGGEDVEGLGAIPGRCARSPPSPRAGVAAIWTPTMKLLTSFIRPPLPSRPEVDGLLGSWRQGRAGPGPGRRPGRRPGSAVPRPGPGACCRSRGRRENPHPRLPRRRHLPVPESKLTVDRAGFDRDRAAGAPSRERPGARARVRARPGRPETIAMITAAAAAPAGSQRRPRPVSKACALAGLQGCRPSAGSRLRAGRRVHPFAHHAQAEQGDAGIFAQVIDS